MGQNQHKIENEKEWKKNQFQFQVVEKERKTFAIRNFIIIRLVYSLVSLPHCTSQCCSVVKLKYIRYRVGESLTETRWDVIKSLDKTTTHRCAVTLQLFFFYIADAATLLSAAVDVMTTHRHYYRDFLRFFLFQGYLAPNTRCRKWGLMSSGDA